MSQERPGLRRAVVALEHRDYRLFYSALVVAGVGSQIQTTANIWQIYDLTHSPLHIGLTGLARAIPIVVLSLVGGIIADRVDRRRVIMVGQGVSGLIAIALAVLTYMNLIEIWHIYAATLVSGIFMALSAPARNAVIPNLVPRHHLLNAVALNSTVYQVSNIVGPAVAGVLIAAIGLAATYLINGTANLIALLALALVVIGPIAATPKQSAYRSLVEGLSFVRRTSVIPALLATDTAATFFGHYRVLLPFIAAGVGMGPEGLGLLLAAPGVGALLGAGGLMSLGDVRYKGILAMSAILSYCVALVLLAASPWFLLSLLVAGCLGLFDSLQATSRNTVIQSITPDEMRGRVSSFQQMLTNGVPSLGQAWAGAVASLIGPPLALTLGAAACAALVLGIGVSRADLRARDLGSEPATDPSRPAIGRSAP
jgi:MFS family permease